MLLTPMAAHPPSQALCGIHMRVVPGSALVSTSDMCTLLAALHDPTPTRRRYLTIYEFEIFIGFWMCLLQGRDRQRCGLPAHAAAHDLLSKCSNSEAAGSGGNGLRSALPRVSTLGLFHLYSTVRVPSGVQRAATHTLQHSSFAALAATPAGCCRTQTLCTFVSI